MSPIDGHHKLVRWRMVTHAAIDGYSRLVVFLQCSNNNKASTVCKYFLNAVQQYGLPSRVRSDQGKENTMVDQYMLENGGLNRGSMIVGSFVHNQRIERLWRDLHRCVTQLDYRLFYHLEYQNLLNPVNEYHLFALHYVFLPRLNRSMESFMKSWNSHSLRTEHGHSPIQLFSAPSILRQTSEHSDAEINVEVYGVEEVGIVGSDNEIAIPDSQVVLTMQQERMLQRTINPLSESENYGMELYEQTLDFFQICFTIITAKQISKTNQ